MAIYGYKCTRCESVKRIEHRKKDYPKLTCVCGAISSAAADDKFREATQKAYDRATGTIKSDHSSTYRPISKVTLGTIEGVIETDSITHEGFM